MSDQDEVGLNVCPKSTTLQFQCAPATQVPSPGSLTEFKPTSIGNNHQDHIISIIPSHPTFLSRPFICKCTSSRLQVHNCNTTGLQVIESSTLFLKSEAQTGQYEKKKENNKISRVGQVSYAEWELE